MNAKGICGVVPLLVSLWCPVGSAQETLLTDVFARADSATVGNGWVETEATGAAAAISNGQLVFVDTSDVVRRPMVVRAFSNTTSGLVVWEFQLNWSRTGGESVYAVYMQLGDGSQMTVDSIDAGVAVNLVWTRIGGVDQQLGFRRGGAVTALRAVNGAATVRVTASLAQATYDVAIDGAVVRSQVPFDSTVPLNSVRLFTDALNEVNFAGRSFDSLSITREAAGGGNVAPVAANDDYSVAQDNVLSIAAPGVLGNDVDADGDALTARLVSNVSRGSLSLSPGGSFSYSPDVGFTGTDAFTYVASDGTHESAVATVSIEVGQQPVLFTDSFARANGATVGNGWVEVEAAGAATVLDAGRLTFADTSDVALRPLVRHSFSEVTSGSMTWEFEVDWTRVGSESAYAVYMQLGDGAQMSNDVRNAGVGVNLAWTRIGTQDQMLGFSRSGTTTALRQVVGHATIRVNVDVDANAYDVFVDGTPVRSGIPFDVNVALNTVRFFTDGLNEVNFSGRAFDNVSVRGRSSGGGGNTVPTARAQSLRVADGVARTITLTYTDGDGPGPYTFDVVDLPRHGTLGDDDGDATVVYTASSGFIGADSFTFRVNDGLATSSLATVSLSVQHYPGATWETRTPAQVGLDAARLDQFVASVGGVGSIVRNGYMVRTWGDQTLKDDWASASKPLINTLLFFAVQENRIDRVEDPVRDLVLPATGGTLRPADQSMTFFQLMNMTSGYARIENPGAAWAYNDVAVQLKNLLVGEVFGELPDAPIRARLAPLQLQDGSLFTTRGGYGLSTTTRDFARIAWFWMNRGSWRGQQVLDQQFFDDYMKVLVPFSLPRTTGADVDYLNVGTAGGGTDQTPYGPGQFGMNWWFNQPVGSLGRPWPAAPADMIQTHGHFNREMVIMIPSLNLVITNRGGWGTFVPFDANSGINQRLMLLMLAVTS